MLIKMKELLLQILIVAYACVAVINIIAYWPTIRDLYYHKKPSANIASYILWTTVSGITFLYSIFVLPDLLFRMVSALGLTANLLVLLLSINLRYSKSKNTNKKRKIK